MLFGPTFPIFIYLRLNIAKISQNFHPKIFLLIFFVPNISAKIHENLVYYKTLIKSIPKWKFIFIMAYSNIFEYK